MKHLPSFFLCLVLASSASATEKASPFLDTSMPVFSLFDQIVRLAVRADELKPHQLWLDDQLKKACHNVTLFFEINNNIRPGAQLDFDLISYFTLFVDTVDSLASTPTVRKEVTPLTSFLTAEGKARLLKELVLRKDVEWLARTLEPPSKAANPGGKADKEPK